MSQRSVKLVRGLVESFNRRDFAGMTEAVHEDFELRSVFAAIDSGGATYSGPDAWNEYIRVMDESWEDWRVADPEVFDGDDGVACVMRLVGKGRQSGAAVDRTIGIAYWLRSRRVWRAHAFLDPAEALEAVGLSE